MPIDPISCSIVPATTYPPRIYAPFAMGTSGSTIVAQLEQPSYQFNETLGTATMNVLLSDASAIEVRVPYEFSAGTASVGSDYSAINGTLVFSPGETSKSISLSFINDTTAESGEYLYLRLLEPTNARLEFRGATTISILDDDQAITLQSAIQVSAIQARRDYQWALTVTPNDAQLNIAVGQTKTVSFQVNAERGSLGPTIYDITGSVLATNTGNLAADLQQATVRVEYQTTSSTWVTATTDLLLQAPQVSLTPNQQQTIPINLSFAWATADGSMPANVSALRLVSNISLFGEAGMSIGPFQAIQSLSLPNQTPTVNYATIQLAQTGSISPSTAFNLSGGGANHSVGSTPLTIQTSYQVTRLSAGDASMSHLITASPIGIGVSGETLIQAAITNEVPVVEFRELTPRSVYSNQTNALEAQVRIRPSLGLNTNAIDLVELDRAGNVLQSLAPLYDDGLHNDQLARDGIYATQVNQQWSSTGYKRLAARAILLNGQVLLDQAFDLHVLPERPESDWQIYSCVGQAAYRMFSTGLNQGATLEQAQQQTLVWLNQQPSVASASLNESVIDIDYSFGLSNEVWVGHPNSTVLGNGSAVVETPPATHPASPLIVQQTPASAAIFPASNKAIILHSVYTMVGTADPKVLQVQRQLANAGYAVTVKIGTEDDLETRKTLDSYGVIWTIGHGNWPEDVLGQYTFSTGHLATESARKKYAPDIDAGRLKTRTDAEGNVFYTRSSFYETYYAKKMFPNSLWIMLNCSGTKRQHFANILHNKRLSAFIGFNELVPANTGLDYIAQFFEQLTVKRRSVDDALGAIPNRTFTWIDSDTGENVTTTFGASSGSNLQLRLVSGLRNGDFELGNTEGWNIEAGRRLVNVFRVPPAFVSIAGTYGLRLGPVNYPPANGVGTSVAGSDGLRQRVVIPLNSTKLSFDYVMSSYLPSNGSFRIKIYAAKSNTLLLNQVILQAGTGNNPTFWHSGQRRFNLNIGSYTNQEIDIVLENQQNGTNDQAVYIDNISIR
ncbi:hypothetical protein Hgul01_04184 [Herpetosiphon gulosus]|uniref:Calx-beta domain-containing protein n=2 Tax=Herpetosiphon gulosus TaxID=1973496 RepID=A0ABP9X746_9CHLR